MDGQPGRISRVHEEEGHLRETGKSSSDIRGGAALTCDRLKRRQSERRAAGRAEVVVPADEVGAGGARTRVAAEEAHLPRLVLTDDAEPLVAPMLRRRRLLLLRQLLLLLRLRLMKLLRSLPDILAGGGGGSARDAEPPTEPIAHVGGEEVCHAV